MLSRIKLPLSISFIPFISFVSFISLGLVSVDAFADGDQNRSVNIDVNPAAAQVVSTQPNPDGRLQQLRKESDKSQLTAATQNNQSYVSQAPDPNNPNYWKEKNAAATDTSESSKGDSQDSLASVQDQQVFQAQTAALQKTLEGWQSGNEKNSFTSVSYPAAVKEDKSKPSSTGEIEEAAIALPGTSWYATIKIGADSYVPGPVTAEIEEGPLSGGIAIGKFEVAPDGEHLILTFNTLSCQNKTYSIDAVAVDPKYKISGVTGEIDHHIMTRFILPAASKFLTALTQALLSQDQSVVSNQAGFIVTSPKLSNAQLALMGGSGAAQAFADATQPQGVMRLPEVKIQANQDIGFLLLKPIV